MTEFRNISPLSCAPKNASVAKAELPKITSRDSRGAVVGFAIGFTIGLVVGAVFGLELGDGLELEDMLGDAVGLAVGDGVTVGGV